MHTELIGWVPTTESYSSVPFTPETVSIPIRCSFFNYYFTESQLLVSSVVVPACPPVPWHAVAPPL